MLYLFLTGQRAAYLNDIFTVLNLPENSVYDLKYRVSSSGIVDNSTDENNCKAGTRVLINYTDTQGGYIPLRWGRLQGISEEEGQRYYSIKLTEYCHTYSDYKYNEFLTRISNGRLRYVDSVKGIRKGILAFCHSEMPENIIKQEKNSWSITVRQLGDVDLFKEYYSIFTKIEIKSDKNIKAADEEEKICFLNSKQDYNLHFTYYIPQFNANPMSDISIQFYQTDKCLGLVDKHTLLLSEQNKIDIPCFPNIGETEEKVKVALQFDIPKKEIEGKTVQYAMTPVEIEIRNILSKRWRMILTSVCVIGVFLASFVNSFDFSSALEIMKQTDCPNKLGKIVCEFLKTKSIWTSTITTLSTWGMVKLIGKAEL